MAAAAIRLMNLAGARRALRRWFRRGWPLGDSSDDEEEGDGPAVPPAPPNTPAETSLLEDNDISLLDNQDEQTPEHTDSDKSLDPDTPNDDDSEPDLYNDSTAMSFHADPPAPTAGASQQAPAGEKQEKQEKQQSSGGQIGALTEQMSGIKVTPTDEGVAAVAKPISVPGDDDPNAVGFDDPAVVAERAVHLKFIGEALDMAKLALRTNETPVGCVLVHDGKVIAKGMNATNVTRNGTRHAEFMAISALISVSRKGAPKTTCLKPKVPPKRQSVVREDGQSDTSSVEPEWRSPDEGNEDGSKGHLYPYGQKMVPEERVDGRILRESILYVTVEPCVMCASLLRQLGIKKVYFGAVNDKFGGTGGVFSIHANSAPVSADGQTASAHPQPKPVQYPDGGGSLGTSFPLGGGDGGNIEPGYEIEGGWGRDEAVALLRRFYVQENGRAPVPRKKEGRAARLAAMMEQDGSAPPSSDADGKDVAGGDKEDAAKENVEPGKLQLPGKGKESLAEEGTD